MSEERVAREKDFHNTVFSDGRRSVVDKYYSITKGSFAFYTKFLEENCSGKKVLEYGCGLGSSAFALAKQGADVSGIDISDVGIAQAQREADHENLQIAFHVMDAEHLRFEDHSFDLACGSGILHHLDLDTALKELSRVLKQNGKAIFYEPLGHNPFIQLYRKLTPSLRTKDEHPLIMNDIKTVQNHLEVVDLHYFYLVALLAVPLRNLPIFAYTLKALDYIDQFLFRVFPFLKRYAWIIVIILKH